MADFPIFSVIMACHNAAPYVRQAISSVVGQTFSSWELIIVDDASQDDSLSYIKIASQADSRVRYISSEINMGAAAARNAAIEVAKGEWLAILDADDVYLPHKLEKQYEVIKGSKSNLVLVGAGCFHVNSEGVRSKEYNYSPNSEVLKNNLVSMLKFPPHSSLVYRKSSFLAAGGFNVRFARSEDYELWLRLSELGDFFAWPLPLIEYRLHSTNISNRQCPQTLTQVDYGVAAAVCHIIKNAGLSDPREFDEVYLWREFLDFVATFIKRSGYYEYIAWKDGIKSEIKKEASLRRRLKIYLFAACKSPVSVIRLAEERIFGCNLPGKIFSSWTKSKRVY